MILPVDPFNIIIGGVGGQGNVLASMILGRMLVSQGGIITIGETYGASQRGGSVMSHLRVSTKDQFSPIIPEGKCHLLVALEPIEGLRMLAPYGNPGVMTVVNTRPIQPLCGSFRECRLSGPFHNPGQDRRAEPTGLDP